MADPTRKRGAKIDWGDVAVDATEGAAAGTAAGGPYGTLIGGGGAGLISILGDLFGPEDATYDPYIYNPDPNATFVAGTTTNTTMVPTEGMTTGELYKYLTTHPGEADMGPYQELLDRIAPAENADESMIAAAINAAGLAANGTNPTVQEMFKEVRRLNPEVPETYETSVAQDTRTWLNDVALGFLNNPQVEIDQSDYDYDRTAYFGLMDEILKPQWGFTEEAQSIQDQLDAMNNAIGGYGRHINDLSDIIRGNAPSVAQLEREKSMEQAQRMALSQAASSRDPGAWRAAMDVGSEAANSAAMDAAIIRAKEIESALGLRSDALAGRSDAYADLTGAYSELTNVYDQWGNLIQDHGDSWLKFSELDAQAARDRVDTEIKDLETRLQAVQELMRLGFDYAAEEARLLTQLEIAKVNASVGINNAQTEVYLGDIADTREDKIANQKALATGMETIFETLPIKPKEDEPFIPDQPVQGSPDPNLPDGDPRYVKPKPLDN